MYAEIQAAIASGRVLSDILNASKDLRNFNELAGAVSEVNAKLMQATAVALASQERQSALSTEIDKLKQEIVHLKDWAANAENYEVLEFSTGLFAYVNKNRVPPMKSMQKFCAKCFKDHFETILQFQAVDVGRQKSLVCHRCKSTVVFRNYVDET